MIYTIFLQLIDRPRYSTKYFEVLQQVQSCRNTFLVQPNQGNLLTKRIQLIPHFYVEIDGQHKLSDPLLKNIPGLSHILELQEHKKRFLIDSVQSQSNGKFHHGL